MPRMNRRRSAFELEPGVELRSIRGVRREPTCQVHPPRHPRELRVIDTAWIVARGVVVVMEVRRIHQRRNIHPRVGQVIASEIPTLVMRGPIPDRVELE